MPPADPVTVTPAVLRRWPLPEPGSGKESRGSVLVVAGTVRTPGAALLAGEAALRAGAGKLTVATGAPACASLGVAVPEAMVVPLPCRADGNLAAAAAEELEPLAAGADAVLLGPGFLDPQATVDLLRCLLPALRTPCVLDATASAYLGAEPDGLRHLEGRALVTVNPAELALTLGRDEPGEDLLADTAELARRTGAVVLCGASTKTVVAPDGRSWVVEGGGPGLGVSGSGDVQAGIAGGLLARGAEPAQAAVWAAYLHARTGERLAAATGTLGHLAREQTGQVPRVLSELA